MNLNTSLWIGCVKCSRMGWEPMNAHTAPLHAFDLSLGTHRKQRNTPKTQNPKTPNPETNPKTQNHVLKTLRLQFPVHLVLPFRVSLKPEKKTSKPLDP